MLHCLGVYDFPKPLIYRMLVNSGSGLYLCTFTQHAMRLQHIFMP
jgi:hypothetical protein